MPAREKTSATFLAAAVEPRGTTQSAGEAEIGGLADGCSSGSRYKPVRGELMFRSSRSVAPIILGWQPNYKAIDKNQDRSLTVAALIGAATVRERSCKWLPHSIVSG